MKKAYSAIKHVQKGDMDLIQGDANPFPQKSSKSSDLYTGLPCLG